MDSTVRKLSMALLMVGMFAGIVACDSQGPAEEAGQDIGESIDDTVESVGESMEALGENVQGAAEEAQN